LPSPHREQLYNDILCGDEICQIIAARTPLLHPETTHLGWQNLLMGG